MHKNKIKPRILDSVLDTLNTLALDYNCNALDW